MDKNKLSFKVLLDNFNTSSFTIGSQFNANYYVDFKKLIVNDEDLDKSYYVYVTFKSMGFGTATTGISNDHLYLLSIDFNKGSNTIQYTTPSRPNKNICHVIPINESLERGTSTVFVYFELKDNQQMPTVVNNIRSINTINLEVIEADTYTTFTPTTPAASKYTCILTFVEM